MSIEQIREINPGLKIFSVYDSEFSRYGKVIDKYDFDDLKEYARDNTDVPDKGNVYMASCPGLENLNSFTILKDEFFGEMPIQAGYCNGNGSNLNALEYHKSSEIDIAITDMVLLLGHIGEIENEKYDSSKIKAFYVPQFVSVELYSTTLHFAPCKVSNSGFKCIVVLPLGTNTKLDNTDRSSDEDRLLFAKNKWLLIHEDHPLLSKSGAYIGVEGENIRVEPLG